MANELSLNATLSFTKGNASVSASPGTKQITVSGSNYIKNTISVGVTDETLALGDVTTIGVCLFRNLDATNFITLGSDGTLYPLRLKPLEYFPFRWNAAAVHVKADTAPCLFEYLIISD